MRKFHSYGPVDIEDHFCVERQELIQKCTNQLIGNQKKGGHYFTIWAPRQTGKTWLIRQSAQQIKNLYADSFVVGNISMQGYGLTKNDDPESIFFEYFIKEFSNALDLNKKDINSWTQWAEVFEKSSDILTKPLILFIDEFDKLPHDIIDKVVSLFRHMYLSRDSFMLHGLALIGVRAVLGVDSKKGSPFNVQRSIHIPNLTRSEVCKMFDDYQSESNQKIESHVIDSLYEKTNGQPGLVGWFGELLTEKYNSNSDKIIDINLWNEVYSSACDIEHNNTVQNIIIKGKTEYKEYVFRLYNQSDIRFTFDTNWCNYMYMHGLITYEKIRDENKYKNICRFSSPFIQERLYNALVIDMRDSQDDRILALEPLDLLEDVFVTPNFNIPALLKRYKDYLKRLKDHGENPWANQPRRKSDLHLTEAVGHFHLYHWLTMALRKRCTISPEFPTGNGKVDLHLSCQGKKKGLIEVKSFVNAYEVKDAKIQAAKYAKKTQHDTITIAMFAPFTEEHVLEQLSVTETIDDILVHVLAIGQG
jgi:hypothetical protein